MSTAGVWPGEAVEKKVPDDEQTSAGARETLPAAGEARTPEALTAIDLDASSLHVLEEVVEKLRQLDHASHGALLQRLLRGLTSVEVTEKESIVHWERILARQNELTEKLGRPTLLRTAAVDYFGELQLLRKPILLEYEELEKLRHNAATDPLTGLQNRRMFEEYLVREINRAGRYGTSFVLLLFDLRRFKIANDTYGHAIGDEILRSVARASVETIRGSDIACRIGGDEFAILLPQSERASAEALAERIARKFEAYARTLAPDTPVGIDYGTALFPADGEEATKLFQSADRNLYESKQRASRLFQESLVSARASMPESGRGAREGGAATDNGDRQGASSYDAPPDFDLAGAEIPASYRALDRRKHKRIRVEGARRLGVARLGEKCKAVKVLDLSFGGVCLQVDDDEVADRFSARIQAPFLSDAELTLHRVYCRRLADGKKRVGCSFTPVSALGAA